VALLLANLRKLAILSKEDLVWLFLFTALALVSPVRTQAATTALVLLGFFQLLEPRIPVFRSERGTLAGILIKLVLCYLLMGWTGGINSTYYVLLLLPVVSAATRLSLAGTFGVTLLSTLSYLSFLLFLDWSQVRLDDYSLGELEVRLLFLPIVAFLTYQLAEQNRTEARRSQSVARELREANEHLRHAEMEVRRSERLAALGQLTAGLAHELRNPLGTIRASAEMLTKTLPGDQEVDRELAGFILSEVDRTNSLVTRFLEFARPVHLRMAPANVNELLDRSVAELARLQPPLGVTVHKNYAPDVPPIEMDSELMERVFTNLICNAAEASAAGGTVTLKTRASAHGVEVSVLDRGMGITPQERENIFNPFFTTKQNGVGLGLAIVSKIVDEHGGRIDVDSEPGQGSVFRVLLPERKETA
jgi:two-component system, NtrC family, sensor histidine kinase HydH